MLPGLPELFLGRVCVHLSYEDLFALRCTCKAMKQFVDEKEFKRLNLFVRKYSFNHRLFYTNELVGYPHSLHSDDSAILHSTRFREQFATVQQMVICTKQRWNERIDDTGFDLDSLNCFRALNHLEVVGFTSMNGRLNLEELRVASFWISFRYVPNESSIALDCPRLSALRVHGCWPVLTSNTDQLEHLRCSPHQEPTDYLKSISPNLQKLSTICIHPTSERMQLFSDLKSGRLSLPSLDRVLLEPSPIYSALVRLGELASCLEDLLGDPQTKHIQLYFYGRPIRSPEELRQIVRLLEDFKSDTEGPNTWRVLINKSLSDRSLRFLNENPELEFLLSDADRITLSEDVEWSEEVVKKLKDIERLEFRHEFQLSLSTFELFARTFESLCSWTLCHQTVTGHLLEILSKYLLNLENIRIFERSCEALKPLAKFRNLEYADFDFEPHRDELIFLFENSRTLETVCFVGKDKFNDTIKLTRTTTGPKVLKIRRFKYPVVEFETLHAMIDSYYRNARFKIVKRSLGYD